jgi:hypothetical protein
VSNPIDPWPSSRLFHLTGGVRAYNLEGPETDFEPMVLGDKVCKIRVPNYASAYKHIESLGVQVIGVDFYTHALELKGEAPPHWRVFSRGWPTATQAQQWAEISHAAFEEKNGHLWDLASRISQQVRTCDWQLRQVSQAYAAQLMGRYKQKSIAAGSRFVDGFTNLAYIAIQSYLIDACTLRDYLAEFLAHFTWKQLLKAEEVIDSLTGLRTKILLRVPRPDPLADFISTSIADGGWLRQLGEYRNLIVHTAPLAMAGGRWFATIEHRPFPESHMMPILRLPLPTNPSQLKKERSSGKLFTDFNAQFEAFTRAVKGQVPWVDGLDYLWTTHVQLADLAAQVASTSPVKGKMMTFDDSNIIGEIRRKDT